MLFLFSEEIERDIVGKHGKENSMREGKGKETMKQMRKIENSRRIVPAGYPGISGCG